MTGSIGPAFITLDGPEGGGKTTQVKEMIRRIGDKGVHVREPGGTTAGEKIRAILKDPATGCLSPMTELLLFQAARVQLVNDVILPALAAGKVVVSDRYYDSTMAYQGGARGLLKTDVWDVISLGSVDPDLTLILDVPYEKARDRMTNRGGDRFDDEPKEFHERVRAAFLEIAGKDPRRCAVIDASQGEDKVQEDIWNEVRQRLGWSA